MGEHKQQTLKHSGEKRSFEIMTAKKKITEGSMMEFGH